MKHSVTFGKILLPAALALTLAAATLPDGKPEDAGMSAERLQRIHQAIERHVAAGDISGAVTAVARQGRVGTSRRTA